MEFTEENSEFELDFGEIMEGGEVTGVSSVNGYTGDVVLSAQDVGAATPAQVAQAKADSQTYTDEKVAAVKEAVEAEIPTDTADLTNGAGFQNGVEVASAIASGISDHNSSATAHPAIRTQISTINSKIPAEASVSNQLADKTFVSGLVSDEASARELADTNLQGQIDAITSASDVVDVVGTYSELQAYDTQHLNDNDIVKVLVDETHDNAITYYRWTHSTTPYSWIYIGSQGPFYTKAESDTLLNEKADKSNTYTKTEVDTALAGKVDKVAGKGLSTNDFTTEEKTKLAGLENTVLESTTGQSTTAGMTQKAITDMIYSNKDSGTVRIGSTAVQGGVYSVAIGTGSYTTGGYGGVAIGHTAKAKAAYGIAIGDSNIGTDAANGITIGDHSEVLSYGAVSIGAAAKIPSNANGSVAIGMCSGSGATAPGMVDISSTNTSYGYNSTNYRLLTGLHDGQSAHDAATLAQGNTLASTAPTTSTVGVVGQLYTDTSTGKLYHCTAVSGSTYAWSEISGGGGGGVQYLTTSSEYPNDADGNNGDICYSSYRQCWFIKANGAWTILPVSVYKNNLFIRDPSTGNAFLEIGSSNSYYATKIGLLSNANPRSVGLGYKSSTRTAGTVSVGGSSLGTEGYKNTQYRVIENVHDGEQPHDAMTVGQANALIDAINAALNTNIAHIGASA